MKKKILVGVPCMGTLPVQTVSCLMELREEYDVWFERMSLVYIARERIIEKAIAEDYDYVMFIDSDMTFSKDIVQRLMQADKDIVTGLAFMRLPPYNPCIYDIIRVGEPGENEIHLMRDWKDGVEEIEGCGMACCLIKTDVFRKIRESGSLCYTPGFCLGEDLAFCVRARMQGFRIFCDTTVRVGHLGQIVVTEDTWHQWNA